MKEECQLLIRKVKIYMFTHEVQTNLRSLNAFPLPLPAKKPRRGRAEQS